MGYWQRWEGSTNPEDESGTAHFVVDGVRYSPRLPSFESCSIIDDLLEAAFRQGKKFAADSVQRAIDVAREKHALYRRSQRDCGGIIAAGSAGLTG